MTNSISTITDLYTADSQYVYSDDPTKDLYYADLSILITLLQEIADNPVSFPYCGMVSAKECKARLLKISNNTFSTEASNYQKERFKNSALLQTRSCIEYAMNHRK